MHIRLSMMTSLILVLVAACNLGASDQSVDEATLTPFVTATDSVAPSVDITSPDEGDEVVVNQSVLVEVNTAGNADSVELFVNSSSVQKVRISDPSSSSSRSVLNFTPASTGDAILRVVAYRGNVGSIPSEVTISVRENQSQVIATSTGPFIDPNDPTCRALVNAALNFRRSPDTDASVIRILAAGEVLPIVGRLADNTWLQLRSNTTIGWVSSLYVTRYGNCTGLAIISPPSTPTNTPLPSNTPRPVTQTPLPSETPAPLPNLIVASISGPEEVTIPAGEDSVDVEYSVVVTNLGGALDEQFLISGRILPVGDLFDFGVVGSLGVNQSINIDGDVTFSNAGSFALQFIVDSDDSIDESRENDNSGILDVTIEDE